MDIVDYLSYPHRVDNSSFLLVARENAERRERTLIRNYNRALDELNAAKEALDSEKFKNTDM